MYELNQISDTSFYINSPTKIGIIKLNENEVCLIDSGNDKDAGRKVRKILDENNWKLVSIYNTHSHADHIGGNKYLQNQTNCKIYAPEIECEFTTNPIMEPSFLFGAYPPKKLKHKSLMAQNSDCEHLKEENLPPNIKMISLKGHSYNMVGFRTDDDVVYLADCLFSEETLRKYQIIFIYDVGAYLQTLEYIKQIDAKVFVPSHAPITDDIVPLAQINIDKVNEIAERILSICRTPICFEQLLKKLFEKYNLKMNFDQYLLVGSTIKAYLSWLRDNDKIDVECIDNMILWQSK